MVESTAAGWSRLAETRAAPSSDSRSWALMPVASSSSAEVGGAPEQAGQLGCSTLQALEPFADLEWQPDDPAVLLDRSLERLADPPRGVG